ncbi:MAG: hypothetical protein H0U60_19980 [Blastocatellia bacterium]|nr:hypothetical protein [Blastocatellia bacterium]
MFEFLVITIVLAAIAWAFITYLPKFGGIVAAVLGLIWVFMYLLPFLGVSL